MNSRPPRTDLANLAGSRGIGRAPGFPGAALGPALTLLLIAVLCAAGCQNSIPGPDAAIDAFQSFDQPIGATCDAAMSLLCAGGVGACHAGVCTPFCRAVELPRCPDHTTEVHEPDGDRQICLCVRS
jgi:hypothetical protein